MRPSTPTPPIPAGPIRAPNVPPIAQSIRAKNASEKSHDVRP
jgi:hypothetical protein